MASTYLSKTFGQAGNRRTFTISYWIKMGQVSTGADQAIMGAAQDGSNSDDLYIHTGRLNFSGYYGSTAYQVRTTAKYRDLSGWYHHVIRFDSTQSTASDRLRLYVNGELQTALDNNTYPSQDLETTYFNTARLHTIGSIAHSTPNLPFNGSMSHFHFCDGYSYGADSFGETDSTTGEWKIKTSPSVSYGTNGFFILKDGNSVTDQSGQSNNWAVGGGTLTKTEDCPSNVFCTWNPLQFSDATPPNTVFGNGNCSVTTSASSGTSDAWGTLGADSGKYYYEVKLTNNPSDSGNTNIAMGWGNATTGERITYYGGNGYQYYSGGSAAYGASYTQNDIIGCAVDLTNGTIEFYKNGASQGSITNRITTNTGFWQPLTWDGSGSLTASWDANFGNGYFGTTAVSSAGTNASGIGIFEYDVPANYTAFSTKGLNE